MMKPLAIVLRAGAHAPGAAPLWAQTLVEGRGTVAGKGKASGKPGRAWRMRAAATAAVLACGALLGHAAHAQATRSERLDAQLKAADSDGDGLISRAEAQRAFPKWAQRFDEIDLNRDGYLSREEIAAYRTKRQSGATAGKS
jgi:hypothetical protein